MTDSPRARLVSVDVGCLDVGAARRLLVGWEPTPLRRWVAATVRWARPRALLPFAPPHHIEDECKLFHRRVEWPHRPRGQVGAERGRRAGGRAAAGRRHGWPLAVEPFRRPSVYFVWGITDEMYEAASE
jgi:hypothetical protein